jgi:hypothetical protein
MDVVSVQTLRRSLIISGSRAPEQAFPAGGADCVVAAGEEAGSPAERDSGARGAVSRVARIVPSVLRSADGPPAQVVDRNDAQLRSRRVVT